MFNSKNIFMRGYIEFALLDIVVKRRMRPYELHDNTRSINEIEDIIVDVYSRNTINFKNDQG